MHNWTVVLVEQASQSMICSPDCSGLSQPLTSSEKRLCSRCFIPESRPGTSHCALLQFSGLSCLQESCVYIIQPDDRRILYSFVLSFASSYHSKSDGPVKAQKL